MKNTLLFVLALYAPGLLGSGWNDYNLDIGDGYSIFRANTFEVVLAHNIEIIVSNHKYSEIGPITHYYKNGESIFLKTAGWEFRNRFKGASFKNIDRTKDYYFIVNIESKKIKGPFKLPEFNQNIEVKMATDFKWIEPKNPNFWTPLLGNIYFILLSILILPIKVWYISIPIIIVVCWIAYWRFKQKRRST